MTLIRFCRALPWGAALAAAALALYAYRELPGRPFAADDFQWLLNVRGLSPGELLARSLDPARQSSFLRPLVWLLFWGQVQLFGLDPRAFHLVSLALHLLNAGMLAALLWRLQRAAGSEQIAAAPVPSARCLLPPALVFAFAALHPAPFEAVVWVSAQSELLAAALLLAALHLWRSALVAPAPAAAAILALLTAAALGAALLAKESAAVGLGLLLLLPGGTWRRRLAALAAPAAVTAAYLGAQAQVLAGSAIVRGDAYGLGPQLILNPLRTLGLLIAPLPGTQFGDAWWLPWAGAAVALAVAASAAQVGRVRPAAVALLLVLLPAAPFASPPDSRYTYLPVLAFALLLGVVAARGRPAAEGSRPPVPRRAALLGRWGGLALALLLAWPAAQEVAAREGRFAAATGPGGSLWRLAESECAGARPSRVVVVEPPLAPPHAEAIVRLACPDTLPVVVGREGVEDALRGNSLVVAFPGGAAQVERRT